MKAPESYLEQQVALREGCSAHVVVPVQPRKHHAAFAVLHGGCITKHWQRTEGNRNQLTINSTTSDLMHSFELL